MAIRSLGTLDYYGFIYDAVNLDSKFVIACSVSQTAYIDGQTGFTASTTKYREEDDRFTASNIFVIFESLTGIQGGDNIVVYCRYRYLYPCKNTTIPVFHADGWQRWDEYLARR